MKYIVNICFWVLLVIACDKDESNDFGKIQTHFEIDSVYKTMEPGFLYVQLDASLNNFSLSIYADEISPPETKIAYIRWHGSVTYPLPKDTYWKVRYDQSPLDYIRFLNISWTPIE